MFHTTYVLLPSLVIGILHGNTHFLFSLYSGVKGDYCGQNSDCLSDWCNGRTNTAECHKEDDDDDFVPDPYIRDSSSSSRRREETEATTTTTTTTTFHH